MEKQPNLSKFIEVYKRLLKEGRIDLSKLEQKNTNNSTACSISKI